MLAYGLLLLVALSTTLALALFYLVRIARGLARLRSALAGIGERTAPLDRQLTRLQQTFAVSADEVGAARARLVGDAEAVDGAARAKPLTNSAPSTVQ